MKPNMIIKDEQYNVAHEEIVLLELQHMIWSVENIMHYRCFRWQNALLIGVVSSNHHILTFKVLNL